MGKRRCDDSLEMRRWIHSNINLESVNHIICTDCARRGSSKDELNEENDNADGRIEDCT